MLCRVCGQETGSRAEVCPSSRATGRLVHSPCARRMMQWRDAIRVVEEATGSSVFRPPESQRAGEVLVAMAARLLRADPIADLSELCERVRGLNLDPERARKVSRLLTRTALAVEQRAKITARQRAKTIV